MNEPEYFANPAADSGTAITLDAGACREAWAYIREWPGYQPTPLVPLPGLAAKLGVGHILYKDEGQRLGLKAFKALGGAYAVQRLLEGVLDPASITVTAATAGNHGRAVAWGARTFGCRAVIFIYAAVSAARQEALEALGAEVIRIDGTYDDSVRAAGAAAEKNGWSLVSDTSFPGLEDITRRIMCGYTLIGEEVSAQCSADDWPTHVFIQGGVGGLAGAVASWFVDNSGAESGRRLPRLIVVEPAGAACLMESARQGLAATFEGFEGSVMGGLSCAEPSAVAWEILAGCASDFMTVGDEGVVTAMLELAEGIDGDPPIVAGESAVAGLLALKAAAEKDGLRQALGLTAESRALLIGTEGDTDPASYQRLLGIARAVR